MVPEMMKTVLKREFTKGKPGRRQGTPRTATVMALGLICIILAAGLPACSSGAGSSTSAGSTGTGGSGVGWTVNVKLFSSTLSLGESTSVVVTVRDAAGAPALKGTRICLSTTHGQIWVDELGKDEPVVTGCVSTSNDIGQLLGTYVPLRSGTDQVQASSMGGFGSATVQIRS